MSLHEFIHSYEVKSTMYNTVVLILLLLKVIVL